MPVQNKWAVLRANGQTIATPEEWLKGGSVDRFDAAGGHSLQSALVKAQWVLCPGSHKDALVDIGCLHSAVSDIFALVDDGFIDRDKAILAFKQTSADAFQNLFSEVHGETIDGWEESDDFIGIIETAINHTQEES